MSSVGQLKTLEINTQQGRCIINGIDLSKETSYLKLEFENGEWSLHITTEYDFSSMRERETTKAKTSI